ncbi:MAG: phenylalanine--tRNA ligase beta subunit-related protein [Balneolaceae bacterium]
MNSFTKESRFMIENHLQDYVRIGFITATDIQVTGDHPELERRLEKVRERRKKPLTEREDDFRIACRDMMRIGSYKPTGRSKPAPEYLLRESGEEKFPRINTVADISNYISLKYLVPVSVWDTEKIEADYWRFRAGREDESYIFNPSGQVIELKDVVTGFVVKNDREIPIVSPVKDSQETKTTGLTRNAAVAVYHPAHWAGEPQLHDIIDEFSHLLREISETVTVNS